MRRLWWCYRPWWLLLDGVRMLVRAAVETRRNSLIWPAGMALRWLAHIAAGSPWLGLWLLVLILIDANRYTLTWGLYACTGAELLVLAARVTGHPVIEGFWTLRRAVSVHKRWPRSWGDYAGRTRMVQAATGKEPSTPVRWRPLVDHPRLSWLFLPLNTDTVEFLVGPPPDRTYTDLTIAAAAMAAKFSFVESIEVDYDSDRSSVAVLTVTFTPSRWRRQTAPVLELVDSDHQADTNPDDEEEVAS